MIEWCARERRRHTLKGANLVLEQLEERISDAGDQLPLHVLHHLRVAREQGLELHRVERRRSGFVVCKALEQLDGHLQRDQAVRLGPREDLQQLVDNLDVHILFGDERWRAASSRDRKSTRLNSSH